jgi:pilus assembly protein CpaB
VGRRILAIAAATVIALVGALLVLIYARGADARAVEANTPTTVYVSTATVPAGTSLKDAQRQKLIAETQTAAKAVPAGALTTIDETNNALLALTEIPPGQYLLNSGFGETPVGQKALQVGAGKLAVSVQLEDPARVGTFVTPGSNLTIFMTYKLKQLDDSPEAEVFNEQEVKGTSVLLENVKVIAMGEASLTPAQKPAAEGEEEEEQANTAPSFLVTLEVTPEQATRLVHGINNYVLYAGLRGADVKVDPRLSTNDLTIAVANP